jgi:putative FmdB family regulatory protein
MPTYSYYCDKCKLGFELFSHIRDYVESPKCVQCGKTSCTYRQYIKDISTQNVSVKKSDSELKTLGDLANRNRDRLSEDQKQALDQKHNDYKEIESTKELPSGMSRMKKTKVKNKWT